MYNNNVRVCDISQTQTSLARKTEREKLWSENEQSLIQRVMFASSASPDKLSNEIECELIRNKRRTSLQGNIWSGLNSRCAEVGSNIFGNTRIEEGIVIIER